MKLIRRGIGVLRRLLPHRHERKWPDAPEGCFPPGHYYSPIPSVEDVREFAPAFYERRRVAEVAGVDLNEAKQLETLSELERLYSEQPCVDSNLPERRYQPQNMSYGIADAIILSCMIRLHRPRRIVEVGSGNSTCVILDTNDMFFDGKIAVTCIEPNPERLHSLLRESDLARVTILPNKLQAVDLDIFRELAAGDLLIIDNSHISRLGSDVNHVFFEVLPAIVPGVVVHVHDIFYPFDYPKSWLDRGVFYNEAYVLRAFLQYNATFRIVYWNQFIHLFHRERLARAMPLCAEDPGASIWIQKTGRIYGGRE